uniref:General transcription factor 3C polypeptide 3 n=1 Tax=Ditylenchus dipsaci TaxID=166011 RepID=A0A915E9Z5_9BILA
MIDGLIGQANVEHARGNSKQALSLLHEAIRQAPRNVDAYNQISDVYGDLNQTEKSFEFKMLAAHMSSKTTAEEWGDVGEMALSLERLEDASACYEKAIKCDPLTGFTMRSASKCWTSVHGRTSNEDKTSGRQTHRLSCVQSHFPVVTRFDQNGLVAEYYISQNDEDKAMEALETFILRSREFREQLIHNTSHFLTGFSNSGYTVEPFPPQSIASWDVDSSFRTTFLARLIVSFIRIGMKDFVPNLVDALLERDVGQDEDICFLEVGRAYQSMGHTLFGIKFMDLLLQKGGFRENADAWFLYGILQQANNQVEIAKMAYEKVIVIQPEYVDARINLSTILQNMGKGDQALEVLKDYDLDSCSQLPDERLLIRQAEVLLEQKLMKQYVKCVRLLLVPHFFCVNRMMTGGPVRSRQNKITISHTLKKNVFEALRGTALERLVKRLGSVAFAEQRSAEGLNGIELHDYALKVTELLHEEQRYMEMLHVVAYAFLNQKIVRTGLPTFQNLLLYILIPYLMNRTIGAGEEQAHQLLFCRIFNAMNFVFCHHQSIGYHRFVMRALAKTPENYPLHIISGNNSLVTGSYRHALGEYFRVWLNNRDDPLVCLLIALTFTHMACKKDISSRHMIAMRGITFMKQYQRIRGCCQEVNYNIGRMLHQLGVLSGAIFFYDRVLRHSEVPMVYKEDEQSGKSYLEAAERYDLKRLAAHNVALIYDSSGNRMLAREVLEEFCVV